MSIQDSVGHIDRRLNDLVEALKSEHLIGSYSPRSSKKYETGVKPPTLREPPPLY
jgi:hypothetical protein